MGVITGILAIVVIGKTGFFSIIISVIFLTKNFFKLAWIYNKVKEPEPAPYPYPPAPFPPAPVPPAPEPTAGPITKAVKAAKGRVSSQP